MIHRSTAVAIAGYAVRAMAYAASVGALILAFAFLAGIATE